jgi:hypothetical protein
MVWQEPHLGQRNIEDGESFVRRLCSKSSSPSNQNLIIPEKILIKTAIIKSKFLNHKKQILDIYQVIIFISQYSTQLRLDKQGSSPLLSDHYPAFKPRGGILVQMLTTLSLLPAHRQS